MNEKKKLKTPSRILPGMFVYEDNTINLERIPGRQIKAVVAFVKRNRLYYTKKVYAVCLHEKRLPWSSSCSQTAAPLYDGREATQEICKMAQKTNGQVVEAAQWCHDYVENGVKPGEAFLPSIEELLKLYPEKNLINKSLEILKSPLLSDLYWSSTADYFNHPDALVGDLILGYKYRRFKYYSFPVRPFIAFYI